ncbi:MAG: hypothetical protein V4642_06685 [Bacteroidota bacterium]
MGLLNILKKEKKYDLPEIYNGIISKEDYTVILGICQQYHSDKGLEISKIDKGEIVIDIDGEEEKRYLDNLVRVLSSSEKAEWQEIIYEHFDKLKSNPSALKYLYKDFEYASQFLRVLIKEKEFVLGDDIVNFVHRIDLPQTHTFLIIEFEGLFHYVRRDDITEWNKTENDLFKIAIENIPEEEIEVKEYEFAEKFTVFIFFSGDFAASLMLDLENRADFTIGEFGTLIAIPTKGTAYAHPIESDNITELIQELDPTIEKFYNEDPGNITTNFYWLYNGKFQIFPSENQANQTIIRLPQDLINLLNKKH